MTKWTAEESACRWYSQDFPLIFAIDGMFVSPPSNLKFMSSNPISNGMVFEGGTSGKWLCHESGGLMNEVSALIKETPQSSTAPPAM